MPSLQCSVRLAITCFLSVLLAACGEQEAPDVSEAVPAEPVVEPEAITGIAEELHRHVAVLASDEFAGRAPATPGEELTTGYLRDQFASLDVPPGNGDSYLQEVPVTEITTASDAVLQLEGANYTADLAYGEDMIVATEQQVESIGIEDSEMVFVGYGIVAPERDWNDYAGVDVRGKTVVILVNDPGYATQDENVFNGNAMTWYGRWVYKYEEAARQGAAAALIIHETGAASYGWDVVRNSWSGPQIGLTAANLNAHRANVVGWLTLDAARDLFQAAGLDLDAQMTAAARPDFEAVPLADITATVQLENSIRTSSSNNVIAAIPGTERLEESIVYTAHWDHLGTNPELEGDTIYNGAVDNATGTAALLSLARLFQEHPQPPERTVVFLAVAAEESGLLGSQWYAENPVYPLETTVANINIDGMGVYGPMRDMVVVGHGSSELEDLLEQEIAAQEGRYMAPEPHPERGYYYRSDHFNFARHGVPSLYAESGEDSIEFGREWGAARSQEYTDLRYHAPADEYDPEWDLTGAALDIVLYFRLGHRLALETGFPNWYEGNEFKAIRDESATARER